MNARATAISQFMDKRVLWSGLLGDITRVLPEGTRLTAIRGSSPMSQKRKKQVKIVTDDADSGCGMHLGQRRKSAPVLGHATGEGEINPKRRQAF